MYCILVQNDHSLVATNRERIMQRSKLVNKMHFLVPTNYDGLDMTATTVCLEYLKPISKEYKTEILVASSELYKEHLEYVLPLDTELTREHGQLELQLTFTCVSMDEFGNVSQYVRKTEPTTITITPVAAWSDAIPDSSLTALDQRLIKTDMMIQQMYDINMALADSVPDDLMVKDGKVYLSQNGQVMANTIGADVLVPRTKDDDGIDDGLIELDGINHKEDDPNCDCGCDHDNFEELDNYVATQPDDGKGNFSELL
jgi:hypothetical protein